MKLVVEIDDATYKDIKKGKVYSSIRDVPLESVNAIANGILLDDLRAEIEQNAYPIVHGVNNHEKGMTLYGILQIIDKYKVESENV